jgi:hypothetical protein
MRKGGKKAVVEGENVGRVPTDFNKFSSFGW